jgi:hypothetical protein
MPSRRDIDPTDIPGPIWEHLMLLEVVSACGVNRFKYRLVGDHFCHAFGRNPTGEYLDEALIFESKAPHCRDYVVGIYEELLRRRRPIYTVNIYTLPGESAPTLTNSLSLPLSADGSVVNMSLTAHRFECPPVWPHGFLSRATTSFELVRETL